MIQIRLLLLLSLFYAPMCQAQADTPGTFTESGMTLQTSSGNIQGTLCLPMAKGSYPVALIIAGSGPTDRNGNNPYMKNNSLLQLSHALARAGIASLRYDKRGIAASTDAGKNEADLRFSDYVHDASAWVDTLKKDTRFSGICIIGHSEGSLIGMLSAAKADRFISIAGPGEPAAKTIRRQLADQPETIKQDAYPRLDSLENGLLVKTVPPLLISLFRPSVQPYLISWFRYDPSVEIAKLKIPVLILQGREDIQVNADDAQKLAAANKNASLLLIDHMNHVLKNVTGSRADNLKTYNNPDLPVSEELTNAVISFIRNR